MRTKHRIDRRFIALFLAVATLLASLNMLAYVPPVIALGEEGSVTIREDALHFFIRHWHTDEDNDAEYNPDQNGDTEEDYFVIVEGYIMPDDHGPGKYVCYFVNQNDLSLIPSDSAESSPYIESFDPTTGTVVLKTKPLMDGNDPLETFAGISVSAGFDAVKYDSAGITITYDPAITLVKGHVFYRHMSMVVTGTIDENAFAGTGLFDDPQIDTAWAYTYAAAMKVGEEDKQIGDLVMSESEPLKACTKANELPDYCYKVDDDDNMIVDHDGNKIVDDSVVRLTKFYSTAAGLHTDKTLMQTADGRLFLYSLEAWYIEGLAPQIGLVLDASGSMGFAAETPSAINVKSIILALTDAGRSDEAEALTNKINAMSIGPQGASVYPQLDKLIGYYPFDGAAAPMTYMLDAAALPEGDISGGSYGTANFFTLYSGPAPNTNISVRSANVSNFDGDTSGYIGTKYLDFGGNSSATQRSIQFTISRAATLKVWWEANMANRALRILSESGAEIGTSEYDNPGTGHYYTIHLDPGTYSISGVDSTNTGKAMFIYKAEVEEDPIPSAGDPMTNGAPGYEANTATRVGQADFSNGNFAFSEGEDGSAGLSVGDSGLDYSAAGNYGVLLDAKPSINNGFTVSFTLTSTSASTGGNLADILYIGALTGNTSDANYYRGYRNSGTSAARFVGGTGYTPADDNTNGRATPPVLTNINNVYTTAPSTHVITLVFTPDSVISYMDGVIGVNNTKNLNQYSPNDGSEGGVAFTDDIRIVIDGIQDNYSAKNGTLSIDNVFVYDTALYSDDVKKLYNAVTEGKSFDDKETNWDTVFLSLSEQALILNPNNTDNSALGAAGYNYFVYDPRQGTNAYTPLGYYNRSLISPDVTLNNVPGEGWYYSSYSNQKKTMRGIPSNITATFVDSIDPDMFSTSNTSTGNKGAAPDAGKTDDTGALIIPEAGTVIVGNTDKNYTPDSDSAVKFYIDSKGYLRCFFTTGNNNAFTSYVYELRDNQYVRTEALQRALGSFLNKLTDRSPSTLISAIGYNNANTAKDLLGEETSNSAKAIDLMQNYPLNGGTNTTSGLQMFKDNYMKKKLDTTVGDKFVIIFTDGNDDVYDGTNLKNNATVKLADDLKAEGYTIYTVMLASGSLNKDNPATEASYNKAREFLCALAGTEDVTVKPVDKNGEEGIGYDKNGASTKSKYFYAPTTVDELANSFVVEILKNIAPALSGYTVQDYIDPRFDLVTTETVLDADGKPVTDADGSVKTEEYIWYLQANGKVEKVKKSDGKTETVATYTVSKTSGTTVPLSGKTIPDARKSYLHYDKDADMFYLQWVNQTIPTSAVGATWLEIWYAEVWVRAKEDFIGGNAVLVGGNAEKMNWVYHPGDLPKTDVDPRDEDSDYNPTDLFGYDASSGTGDAEKTYKKDANGKSIVSQPIDAYPSKGFPRVVANVALLPIKTNPLSSVIYMGEAVSPKQILTEIKDAYMTETYYLEYLKRFAYARYDVGKYHPDLKKQMDRPLLDLLTEWLEIENDDERVKAFSVPYMYLPAVEWDEDSGKIALNEDGSAKTIYNNVGRVETNQRCIVGVLTYRWEQLDPEPETKYEPIKDYVKTNTDRVIYSLTVEFTPLRVGDTYALFYGTVSDNNAEESEIAATATTAEGYPIFSIDGTGDSENDPVTYAATGKGPFEKYLRIDDDHKAEVQEDTRLDREKYINGNLDKNGDIIGEGKPGADHRGSYALISDTAYKWNKNHKPAFGNEELVVTDAAVGNGNYPYGDALPINPYGTKDNKPDYRTLKAISTYTADVVSGGIELEMKVLIGELKKAVAANGDFKYAFTVPVTRSFQETAFIEELKKTKYTDQNGNSTWEDYGSNFNITFSFVYTAEDIAALTKDKDGYVTIYAKATSIDALSATFKKTSNEETQTQRIDAVNDDSSGNYDLSKSRGLTELPIGTYEIKLSDINDNLPKEIKENLHFATEEIGENLSLKYFQQNVLDGLHTTKNGTEWNGSEKRDDDGEIIEGGKYETGEAEITEDNIDDFMATGTTAPDKTLVTFYIGTAVPDADPTKPYEPVRGAVKENPYVFDTDHYINSRLGMLRMSTGMTMLTIGEIGGQSNETFLYHITGKTLGDVDVNLTVSVQGGGSTTIVIPPGDYTITEDDWSWRYTNVKTYGKYDADPNEDLHEDWEIDSGNWKEAKVSLRYKDDPENNGHKTIEEHKTVIYEHARNDKVWLGGENHLDNRFAEK